MATSNSRDVRLGVEIQTTGEQSLARLAAQVRALAKEGGDAAPEYARLAGELERLGAEAASLDSIRKIGTDLAATNAAVQEAVLRAAALREEYQRQGAAIESARAARAALQAQLDAVALGLIEEKRQLDLLKAARADDTVSARANAVAQKDLETRVASLTAQKRQLKIEVQAAGRALSDASQGYAKLGTAAESASRNAAQLQGTFRAQASALQDASRAAAQAGVEVADYAAAQQRLESSTRETLAAVNARATAAREQAEADRLAAIEARGLADAQERGRLAAQSEIDALRESERFTRAYTAAAQRRALADFDAAEAALGLAAAQERGRAAAQSELAAIRESEQFMQRYEAALREAAAAQDAFANEAMRELEAAARRADAEFERLTGSLRETEQAAREYAAAVERAAAASSDDVAAKQAVRAAAERLLETERSLTVAGRELARARDVSRAAALAEAQALLTTARAAEEAQAKIAQTAREARQAGQALEQAFGTVGIRSIDAIETEIEQVNRALARLSTQLRAGTISQQEFDRAAGAAAVKLEALRREVNQVQALPNAFERLSGALNGAITKFGALAAAAATVGFAVAPAVKSFIALEQATRILTQVTGSATEAARQVEFLRNVAQRSGQEFDALSKSYAKFAASALQTGLSTQTIQGVFESVAVAAGNLGLSSDQAGRALEALSQIASKGVVGMEELRQQLGDALPGVLPLLATELGLTTAELNKVVESGQLLASEGIPAIGRALRKLGTSEGKPVEGLVAEFNRLKNAVFETTNILATGAIGSAIGSALSFASQRIKEFLFLVSLIGESFTVVGKQIGITLAAIVNRDFKNLGDALAQVESESRERLGGLAERLTGVGAAAENAGARTGKAADAMAASIGQAGESYAKLALEQAKSVSAAELATQVAEKRAQAAATEFETIQKVTIGLLSEAEAIVKNEQATAALLRSKEGVVSALREEERALSTARAAVIAKADADGTGREAIQQQIDLYDKKLTKVRADIEAADAQVLKARELANAAALSAQTFGDQSGRIQEYRNAVEGATRAYEATVRALQQGKATTDELARADQALALAKNLLRDALGDLNARLEQNLKLLRADADLKKAGLELEIAQARNRLAEAERLGQETRARQEGLRILELEQAVRRLSTSSKREEIELTLREIDAQERSLRASGEWTEAKQIELEVRRKSALAQLLEAQAKDEAAKAQDREIDAIKRGETARGGYTERTAASTSRVREHSDALDGATRATDRNTDSTKRAGDALSRYNDLLRFSREFEGLGGGLGNINPDPNITGVRGAGGAENRVGSGANFSVLQPTGTSVGGGSVQYPAPGPGQWQFVPDQSASGGTTPSEALLGQYRTGSNNPRYQFAVNGVGYWVGTSAGSTVQPVSGGSSGGSGGVSSSPSGGSVPGSAQNPTQTIVLQFGSRSATVNADAQNARDLVGILQEAQRLSGG